MNKFKIMLIFGLSFFAKDAICAGKIIFINLTDKTVKTRIEYDGKDDISSGRELAPYGFSTQGVLGTFDKLRISFCQSLSLGYQKVYMGKQYDFSGAVFSEIKKEKIYGKDILVIVGDVNYYKKEAKAVSKPKISKPKDSSTWGKKFYNYGEEVLDFTKNMIVGVERTSKSKMNLDDYFANNNPVGENTEIVFSKNNEGTFRGARVILGQKYNLIDLIKQIESVDVEYDHLKQLLNKKSIKDYFAGKDFSSDLKKELYLKFNKLFNAFESSKLKIIEMVGEFLNKVNAVNNEIKIKLFLSDKINEFRGKYFEIMKIAPVIFGEFVTMQIMKKEEPVALPEEPKKIVEIKIAEEPKEEIKIKEDSKTIEPIKRIEEPKDSNLSIEELRKQQETNEEELAPNIDEFEFKKDKPKDENYDKDLSTCLTSKAAIERLFVKYMDASERIAEGMLKSQQKQEGQDKLWQEYFDKYFISVRNELNKIKNSEASKYEKVRLIEFVKYFFDGLSQKRNILRETFEGLVDFPGTKKSAKQDVKKLVDPSQPIKPSGKLLEDIRGGVKLKKVKTKIYDPIARYKELLEKKENHTLSEEEEAELEVLRLK